MLAFDLISLKLAQMLDLYLNFKYIIISDILFYFVSIINSKIGNKTQLNDCYHYN